MTDVAGTVSYSYNAVNLANPVGPPPASPMTRRQPDPDQLPQRGHTGGHLRRQLPPHGHRGQAGLHHSHPLRLHLHQAGDHHRHRPAPQRQGQDQHHDDLHLRRPRSPDPSPQRVVPGPGQRRLPVRLRRRGQSHQRERPQPARWRHHLQLQRRRPAHQAMTRCKEPKRPELCEIARVNHHILLLLGLGLPLAARAARWPRPTGGCLASSTPAGCSRSREPRAAARGSAHMATVCCLTPSRLAMSSTPTGSIDSSLTSRRQRHRAWRSGYPGGPVRGDGAMLR